MSFHNRTAKGLLDTLFGKTSVFGALGTAPVIHVALSSTTPAEDGTNITEEAANAYARDATVAGDWNAATSADPSLIDNLNAITYAQATGDWVSAANLIHFVLFDALTSGNALIFGALGTAKPVLSGDTASFPAGDLNITLD